MALLFKQESSDADGQAFVKGAVGHSQRNLDVPLLHASVHTPMHMHERIRARMRVHTHTHLAALHKGSSLKDEG